MLRGVLESVGLVDSSPVSQTPRRNLVRWFLLAGCLTAVLIILAGRAPQQFAMPALFPLCVGAGFGLALGELSRVLLIRRRRMTTAVTALCTVIALVVVTVQWYGLYRTKTEVWLRENPLKKDPLSADVAKALKEEPTAEESPQDRQTRLELRAAVEQSEARHAAEAERRDGSLTFAGYLRERWANFGPLKNLSQPWPVVLWVLELALALVLACMLHGGDGRVESAPVGV